MAVNIILIVSFSYAALLSAVMGVYTLQINKKLPQYQLFFAASVSLSLWALSFAMFENAASLDQAFMWRRIGAVGIRFFYVFLLDFLIRLIYGRLSKRGRILEYLMYIPSVILIYVYTVSNRWSSEQFRIIRTSYGWTTGSVQNFWERFFYLYYFGYVFIGIVLLVMWYKKSEDVRNKIIARNILFSFLITYVLGSFTDVIANITEDVIFPEIGPILAMLQPTSARTKPA
ncbi:MAG TPA: histidine kinase N-terminal 7TM domain-containing protein [Lachnospiraceae bacterium]|nr:histidine kinase N-terminal 7TM domain-containing protein [Lachnospiraceae bacterium]